MRKLFLTILIFSLGRDDHHEDSGSALFMKTKKREVNQKPMKPLENLDDTVPHKFSQPKAMNFKKKDENNYPINYQNQFKSPSPGMYRTPTSHDKEDSKSIIDEKSFMEYDEVSMKQYNSNNVNERPGDPEVVSRNQLNETVRKNLEKYAFDI